MKVKINKMLFNLGNWFKFDPLIVYDINAHNFSRMLYYNLNRAHHVYFAPLIRYTFY